MTLPSAMPPTAAAATDLFSVLEAEHDNILRALDVVEAMCERAVADGSVPDADWEGALRFIRRYADRLHHVKEEDVLFPALERAGMSRQGGPIAVMLEEHEEGRRLVSTMAMEVDEDGWDDRLRAARGYVALLRDHIMKENEVLFQMGRSFLPPPGAADLMGPARQMERDALDEGEHAALLAELARLVAAYL